MENTDYNEVLIATLERIRAKIAANINEKGLRASGKTEASMFKPDSIRLTDTGAQLVAVGRGYFQSLELGRPAGRVPRGFAYIIRQWILDKGLSVRMIPYQRQPSERWQPKYSVEERSLRAAAGAIAHNIATRGTRLYQQGGRSDIYTPVLEEETRRLEAEIGRIIANSIKQAL